ncbi:deoxyribose-phosphate aldolase, partial [human gut metagenome]
IVKGTKCVVAAGADFVKSSTGFYTGGVCVGATEEVVRLMMDASEGKCKLRFWMYPNERAFSKADRYGN